jgi:hypothetical protein
MLWFTPKLPIDDEEKSWIDEAFAWLIEEIGSEVIQSVEVVLPTEDFFPDPYDGGRQSIRRMLDRVCEYMDVDPETIAVSFTERDDLAQVHPLAASGESREHALGTYQMRKDGKHAISLDMSQASDPQMMVATIAHELGHIILHGEGRLDPEYEGHEEMTDLITVFYGLGIFNANSSFVFEQWTNSQFQGWRAGAAGYLSEQAFAYALALFAHLRNEPKPAWSKHLSTNVRSHFKSSLRFLSKTEPDRFVGFAVK